MKKRQWTCLKAGTELLVFLQLFCIAGVAGEYDRDWSAKDETGIIEEIGMQLAIAGEHEQAALLLGRGEAYQAIGHYHKALEDFQSALATAKEMKQPVLEIIATQALGYVHFLLKDQVAAETMLQNAFKEAESLDTPALAAFCANRLAMVWVNMDRREEAYGMFNTALDHVGRADDPALEADILRNLARILPDKKKSAEHLLKARTAAANVKSPQERADLLIGVAEELRKKEPGKANPLLVHATLTEALKIAEDLNDARRISQASGSLGALYEQNGQMEDALAMTAKAMEKARNLQAHDLLLLWEWQLARLLRARGDENGALWALRRAVYHIETIRLDIPVDYRDGRSSFRETLSPIYMDLVDTLLARASASGGEKEREALLREAREVVESIKRSEITDYLKEPCIVSLSKGIESLSSATAVLYPVILPDRLEMLVDCGGHLEQRSVPINREKFEKSVFRLAGLLRNGSPFEKQAGEIYSLMIAPVAQLLEDRNVSTLVYVPDGVLRLLPISALLENDRFLIERFAVVTVPALTLLDPAPFEREKFSILLAGLSLPGPVVNELPPKFLRALPQMDEGNKNKDLRGLSVIAEQSELGGESGKADTLSKESAEKMKQFLALPGVTEEIDQLSKKMPGRVLMDESFRLESFLAELETVSFQVVHIASHGFFGGAPSQNFIMTYDKRLDMNRFGALLRPKQLSDKPVELIALSACQTAEGDDRSPLGFAGILLKSGARCALGSLWPVSDKAAKELLPEFYSRLKDPKNFNKAEALRQAQLALMQKKEFRHPFFWSSFILVGNWL